MTENLCHLDNTVFSTGIDGSDIKSNMSLWRVIIHEDSCCIEEGSMREDKGKFFMGMAGHNVFQRTFECY
jgi:hypothetical protein